MSLNKFEIQDGFQEITFELDTSNAFELVIKPNTQADVLVHLNGEGEATIDVSLLKDAQLNLFYLNTSLASKLVENYHLYRDSRLDLAYGDFNDGQCERTTDVFLKEKGSQIYLNSASLVKNDRRLIYRFNHQAQHTFGNMENFVVTLEKGTLSLHAVGRIEKDAANSETHQTTRVLNFNATERASVFPQLFIDNNDVKASHAESSGQVDPEQLYYLKSRGLSGDEAISLIVKGYLSSILENIKNETIRETLLSSIERKVDEVCSR